MSKPDPSYADFFEESRETLLESLADALETLHLQKQRAIAGAGEAEDKAADPPDEGDFLYDFMRLNVQYLNQLARLGSTYSVVAGRALEWLQARVADDTAKRGARRGRGRP